MQGSAAVILCWVVMMMMMMIRVVVCGANSSGSVRGEVGGAHGRHLRGAEVKGRRLFVPQTPLPPVDERREEGDR